MSQELNERDRMVLERAIAGVEADLDEIRDSLAESLEGFEKNLNRAIQGIPGWLAVEHSTVLRWYQFDVDGTTLLLGPRSVAFVASKVETTFLKGFSAGEVIPDSEFRTHSEEAILKINQVEQLARACALEVDAQLSDTLEDIIFDLEEKRERDERALRELVTSGDVDRGSETQREIADLWEEQRTRADEVRHVWERLERLVFEGIEATGDGLAQLREVLSQMDVLALGIRAESAPEALEVEHDRQTEQLPVVSGSEDEEGEEWGATDPDLPGPTAPLDLPVAFRHAERERETEELDRSDFDSNEVVEDEVVEDEVVEDEVVEDEVVEDEVVEDEVVEDEVVEDEVIEDEVIENEVSELKIAADVGDNHDESENSASESGLASRIVREWEGVAFLEKLLVFGPFVAFVVLVGGARLIEAPPDWAYAPMVFPFGFAGVVAWLVLGSVVRHWRVSWPGLKLLHWVEYEEESDWEVVGGRVRVDGRWLGKEGKLYRWKSKENGGFGWIVKEDHLVIFSPERNFTKWSNAEQKLIEIPHGAWLVPESVVDRARGGK